MSTQVLDTAADIWYAKVGSTNMSNGSGPRLQSGGHVIAGTQWLNQFGVSFLVPHGLPFSAATVTKAVITGTVRGVHSCIDNGSTPKMLLERSSDPDFVMDENGQAAECTVQVAGGDVYPGFATTATNRTQWAGTPSPGDTVDITVTALFLAWLADGGRSLGPGHSTDGLFSLMFAPSDGTTFDRTNEARRLAFSAGWTLTVTYSSHAPSAPSVLTVDGKSSGTRIASTNLGTSSSGTAHHTFVGDFADTTTAHQTAGPTSTEIQVSTHSDMSSPLTVSVVGSDSYSSTTKKWTAVRSFAETRGATMYWRARVTDSGSNQSGWSPIQNYIVNRIPTFTSRTP